MKIHIATDKQIEVAVAVIIQPGDSGMEGASIVRSAHPCLLGHIREGAVAVVVVEHIFAILADVEVRPAVVVEIGDGYAQAVTGSRHAGLVCNIGKSTVAVIVVKRVACSDASAIQITAVEKVQVRPAVAVIVENGAPGSRLFQNRGNPFVPVVIAERKSGLRSDIYKLSGIGRRRGGRRRQVWIWSIAQERKSAACSD